MADRLELRGLEPEALAATAEAFFAAFPWEPVLDARELPAGAFLEAL